jgi:hypothetical protein
MFLIGGIIDLAIFCYVLYFLSTIRFYKCINEKMGEHIKIWSYVVVMGGISSIYVSYYSFRALLIGFDYTTKILTILQILVWIFGIKLYYFHIKTTSNEKVV